MTEEQPIVQPGRMEITLLGPALAHAARIHTPLCALCYLGAVGPPGRGLRQGVHEQRGLFVARDFAGNKIKPIARRDARSGATENDQNSRFRVRPKSGMDHGLKGSQ